MNNITIIIPLHKFDDSVEKLINKALESYYTADANHKSELLIIGPKNTLDDFKKHIKILEGVRVKYVENKTSDFCTQINVAANDCDTKYFSILEFDDEYTPHYLTNVEKYIKFHPEYSIILPINEIHDFKTLDKGAVGYLNESFWASSFSEKIGFPDEESLMDCLSTNVTGGVFNTQDFIEIGGLKASIKISFWHEFLLRALHKDKIVFVMPKIGYKHFINREDSLTAYYQANVSEKEAQWWINLAQEEYYYKTDRKKTYEE